MLSGDKMPIIGMNINSIEAVKKGKVERGLKVNNQTSITDAIEQDLTGIGKKGLKIMFTYSTNYVVNGNDVAVIKMTGEVMYVGDDIESIKAAWSANNKLPETIELQVINHVLRKGVTKSLALSEELQLPPPIALPFASKKKADESKYIG